MGYRRYHSILAWDNLWLTVINVHLKKARQPVTHAQVSKTGLLAGSQGQLHGAKNLRISLHCPSSSLCFCSHAKLCLCHTIILSSYMHTLHTLTIVPLTLCFPDEVYRNQATILVSSRGGIGTDIAWLPGHKWNTGPLNATALYTYGDRLWRTPPRQGEVA